MDKWVNQIIRGDALKTLKKIPSNFVHCVITSPPYFNLRDYQVEGQIGLEKTPEEYINRLIAIFQEVKRVLREDGVFWLNIGDSYATSSQHGSGFGKISKTAGVRNSQKGIQLRAGCSSGIKTKDLIGIPWQLVFALRDDGWWLRSDIIWSKPNCTPESVTDRPTKAHEYLFLLTKNSEYFYDQEPTREPYHYDGRHDTRMKGSAKYKNSVVPNQSEHSMAARGHERWPNPAGKNARSVWTIPTQPFPDAHYATFPEELAKRCILAGTSEKGCCAKCGNPWIRILEKKSYGNWNPELGSNGQGKVNAQKNDRRGSNFYDQYEPPKTKGWKPSCGCNTNVQPCVVLDPFMGSGTVALVASKQERNFIGIELSPENVKMAYKRLEDSYEDIQAVRIKKRQGQLF